MLEVFLGAILALAVRDLFYEALEKYKQYKFNKNLKTWNEIREDWQYKFNKNLKTWNEIREDWEADDDF